jgi:hypothetical protein
MFRSLGKATRLQQTTWVNTQVLAPVVLSIYDHCIFSPARGLSAGAVSFKKTGQPLPGQAAGLDAFLHRCIFNVLISLAPARHTHSLGGER